jgi:hypothetical protein
MQKSVSYQKDALIAHQVRTSVAALYTGGQSNDPCKGPHKTRWQSGLGVLMVDLSGVWTEHCMVVTDTKY